LYFLSLVDTELAPKVLDKRFGEEKNPLSVACFVERAEEERPNVVYERGHDLLANRDQIASPGHAV